MIKQVLIGLITTTSLVGCTVFNHTKPIKPLQGPTIQDSNTPYTELLACVGQHVPEKHRHKLVITVNKIPDKTGKFNYNDEGYKVTQGAEDMVMSALAKTDSFTLVERLNLEIPSMEISYSNDFLLSDLNPNTNLTTKDGRTARALQSGAIIGSNYVVVGSISEVNFNLGSGGFDISVDGWEGGWRSFWMDVGMDLRVINTKSTQVVMSLPLRKQIWGYESKLGVVRFFGNTYSDSTADMIRQEPLQLAVRSIIEGAMADVTKELYGLPDNTCNDVKRAIEGLEKDPSSEKPDQARAEPETKAVSAEKLKKEPTAKTAQAEQVIQQAVVKTAIVEQPQSEAVTKTAQVEKPVQKPVAKTVQTDQAKQKLAHAEKNKMMDDHDVLIPVLAEHEPTGTLKMIDAIVEKSVTAEGIIEEKTVLIAEDSAKISAQKTDEKTNTKKEAVILEKADKLTEANNLGIEEGLEEKVLPNPITEKPKYSVFKSLLRFFEEPIKEKGSSLVLETHNTDFNGGYKYAAQIAADANQSSEKKEVIQQQNSEKQQSDIKQQMGNIPSAEDVRTKSEDGTISSVIQ